MTSCAQFVKFTDRLPCQGGTWIKNRIGLQMSVSYKSLLRLAVRTVNMDGFVSEGTWMWSHTPFSVLLSVRA